MRVRDPIHGTIAVSETKLPGHKAHLTLPVSHMGMLVSAAVAEQVGEFLATGHFKTSRQPPTER